jgi:hypothetical protein
VQSQLLQFKHEADALLDTGLGDLADGVFIALWRSPAPPSVPPEPFTGDAEKEPEVCAPTAGGGWPPLLCCAVLRAC